METGEEARNYSSERTIYAFRYFLVTAHECLERAKSDRLGCYYLILAAEAFTAFGWEAFLNYVGDSKLRCWGSIQRNMATEAKLDLLCELSNLAIDKGQRPFQSLGELWRFRNDLVHAQAFTDRTCTGTAPLGVGAEPPLPQQYWQKHVSAEQAEAFLADVEEAIKIVHKGALRRKAPVALEHSSWTVSGPPPSADEQAGSQEV
ncbi:MAG: hypothetical protein GX557_10110 [Chloroflexi bacterium]|nr:hypothetical protein [Chloroflexota bacterium]